MKHENPANYLPSLDASSLGELLMRFRLTYQGELFSRQKDPGDGQWDKLAPHVQSIRKVFHRQLKHLWATNRFLRETKMHPAAFANPNWVTYPTDDAKWGDDRSDYRPMFEVIANNYRENGYEFVPLVREDIDVTCALNILFLRRDPPGSVLSAGDLDNRIKTLIDALRKPNGANELRGHENPDPDEKPFFCLLDDDKSVSQLSVETDTLLDPPAGNKEHDRRQVHLVISVEIRPYTVTMENLSFAS